MNIQCPKCKSYLKLEIQNPQMSSSVEAVCGQCNTKLKIALTVKVETEPPFSPDQGPSGPRYTEEPKQSGNQTGGKTWRKERVLIAMEGDASRKAIVVILNRAGFPVMEAAGGRDALDLLQKEKPTVVLLDVGLPQMFGFELCDIIKKSPSLKEIGVVLVASIYDKNRYRRQPTNLYGADDFIERHKIEDELVSKVEQLIEKGKNERGNRSSEPVGEELGATGEQGRNLQNPDRSVEVETPGDSEDLGKENSPVQTQKKRVTEEEGFVSPQRIPLKAENTEPPIGGPHPDEITLNEPSLKVSPGNPAIQSPRKEQDGETSPLHDGARRLARIIISDIVLYNQKNVEEGLRKGNFPQALKSELDEGKKLYRERVSSEIFNSTGYFEDAIQEFIAKRSSAVK